MRSDRPRNATEWVASLERRLATLDRRIRARGAGLRSGSGSPEGAVTAPVGTLYTRTNGGAGTTLYVKESGTGNTGWAAK